MPLSSRPSNQGLAEAVGRATLFGVGSNFVRVGAKLVTVPIVVSFLGLGGYGIWAFIMSAIAIMRMGSAGVLSGFQKYVAEATGTGDYEGASKLLSTGSIAMLVLSVAVLVPGSLLSRTVVHAVGVPKEFVTPTAHSLVLFALIIAFTSWGLAYQAIVMGAHRVDITGILSTVCAVCEAAGFVISLRLGGGLFGMSVVLAVSYVGQVLAYFVLSQRILPQVQVRAKYLTRHVTRELLSFVGSYQLVGLLEVLYGAILPITVLKYLGPRPAGVYAVACRLVGAALNFHDAFLLPMLSAGSVVFAAGSIDEMRLFLVRAFRTAMGLTIIPLSFISAFSPLIMLAWLGRDEPSFRTAMILLSFAGVFRSISLLQLVLYRASGGTVMDIGRQIARIAIVLLAAFFATRLGLLTVLLVLAFAELTGMALMSFAITKVSRGFSIRTLLPDATKLTVAAAIVIALALMVIRIPVPHDFTARPLAAVKLGMIVVATALAILPALIWTRALSRSELRMLANIIFKSVRIVSA